jgi:hypothetical protein
MVIKIENKDGSQRSIRPTESFLKSEFGRTLSSQELDNKVNNLAYQLNGPGAIAYYNGRVLNVLDKKGK